MSPRYRLLVHPGGDVSMWSMWPPGGGGGDWAQVTRAFRRAVEAEAKHGTADWPLTYTVEQVSS